MAIRKQRLDRKVEGLQIDGNKLAHLPAPWTFVIDCLHHGPTELDFTAFRVNGRQDLAAHFRDAVWGMRHTHLGVTLRNYRNLLPAFFKFLNEMTGPAVTHLNQVTRDVLDAYIAWLGQQLRAEGAQRGLVWSVGAQLTHYRGVKSLFKHLRRWVPDQTRSLVFPRNPFPNAARLIPARQSYSNAESERRACQKFCV